MTINRPSRAQNAEMIANKLQRVRLRNTAGAYPVRAPIDQAQAGRAVVIDELSLLLHRLQREDMPSKDAAESLYQMADVLSGNLPPGCGPAQ
jgi:hypothetical protein